MFFGIITLLTALSMATVAAVFAIYGIIAIFAGMPQFALVMGAVIELGKVVGISWLYRNWNEPTKIKYAMTPLVLVAMMLTSMGIFGLLSKAHLEQTSPVVNNEVQITRLDQQIAREQSNIADAEQVISQLDQSVQTLINFDRIRGPDGALAVRESQAEQRELLRQTIDTAQSEIDRLEDQKLELTQELNAIALEVGPVKYLAELVYGDGNDRTEEAVRWVIIAFIFVFDPMAILLLMAANYTLDNRKKKLTYSRSKPAAEKTLEQTNTISDIVTTEHIEPEPVVEPEPNNPTLVKKKKITKRKATTTTILPAVAPETITDTTEFTDNINQEITQKTSKNTQINTDIETVHDVGNGYVEYQNHLYQKDALKEIAPELFMLSPDSVHAPSSGFGTQFPRIAKKKDIFVRVDVTPNRVYRFDGKKWIETNKDLTTSYLYDEEYLKFLVDKIDKGEYDIELFTEQEKSYIEDYLKKSL